MLIDGRKWQALLKSAEQASVVCFVSCDEYLLESCAHRTVEHLQSLWQDSELTHISGEDFTLEEATRAAGTISFFSTKRLIYISRLMTSSLDDRQMEEFCALLKDTENAVFILTEWCRTERDKKTRKARMLEEAASEAGCFLELPTLRPGDLVAAARSMAAAQGCSITEPAARQLIDRTHDNLFQLSNEVAKLAAGTGYQTVDENAVAALAVRTVEADVFKMVNAILENRPREAFSILSKLLYLKSEPIAICAAMIGNFVDTARMQAALKKGVHYAAVFKELKYTGNEARLSYAESRAKRMPPALLRASLELLDELDTALKSSPVDSDVLLQTAVGELCSLIRAAPAT